MIIKDNHLPYIIFEDLKNYSNENEFQIIKAGDKEFSVLETPEYILPYLEIEGHELIMTFIRSAYEGFDNDLRIHADNIIQGKKTALASVLYISTPAETSPNGTAFWFHHKYGLRLPEDVTNEEFDRLLTEDSNDIEKWELKDIVWSEPNRQLIYPSNDFHSKFPSEITVGVRKVLVSFYSKIETE